MHGVLSHRRRKSLTCVGYLLPLAVAYIIATSALSALGIDSDPRYHFIVIGFVLCVLGQARTLRARSRDSRP